MFAILLVAGMAFTQSSKAQVRFRLGFRARFGPVYVAPMVVAPASVMYPPDAAMYAPEPPVVVEAQPEVVIGASPYYRYDRDGWGRRDEYRRGNYGRRGYR
jgi:hypothetical protein